INEAGRTRRYSRRWGMIRFLGLQAPRCPAAAELGAYEAVGLSSVARAIFARLGRCRGGSPGSIGLRRSSSSERFFAGRRRGRTRLSGSGPLLRADGAGPLIRGLNDAFRALSTCSNLCATRKTDRLAQLAVQRPGGPILTISFQ